MRDRYSWVRCSRINHIIYLILCYNYVTYLLDIWKDVSAPFYVELHTEDILPSIYNIMFLHAINYHLKNVISDRDAVPDTFKDIYSTECEFVFSYVI